jgi:hypothetical protein
LLFVCGGTVTIGLDLEDDREHKLLRIGASQLFIVVSDRSPIRQTITPQTRANDAPAFTMAARQQSSRGPTTRGTLLSLGCLLSV